MTSVDKIRKIFSRLSEIQNELKEMDHEFYRKFRQQNLEISNLENYNLKRIVRNPEWEPINTLEMRIHLIESWEKELKKKSKRNSSSEEE